MAARSPKLGVPVLEVQVLEFWYEVLLGDDQQQQQAPVAAEKQRRVMHACMSF
ncbi:hypothetical protein JQ617_17280 [Bradyrhizobium sp. KB893862 SZCCT0404]|uniref:hypothetical protein n=1 Tax=Bradyrhizobium sp. KB893862 SZCCT0404 TaxID=2807672 RepID=UPI001BA4957D|nr:hypothetical protein [Bradyrhizobium sp. KB893862 SZCCT0404]MBR1175712.1 hypothetical protein [Bradyrhizobium sp. KB893862 SZCCT0404]